MKNLGLFPVLSVFILALACDEDSFTPSGNLDRPSGLSYLQYDDGRGDLFVADAEAQGVRVFQLLSDPLQGGSSLKAERQGFVRAPTVSFPLVMPAPRHPTHLTSRESQVFALSSVDSTIHVLDVGPSTFGVSATLASDDTYKSLATLSLTASEFDNAIPVALRANKDGLYVLFDRTRSNDGLLAKLTLSGEGTATTISNIETASVSIGAPRDFILRATEPLVAVISSAMTSSVALVNLTSGGLGAVSYIGVGGSTHRVIDAEESGVVALRLDRPSIVLLENDGGVLRRSSRRLDNDFGIRSPYTPRSETDVNLLSGDLYGRIDLPNQAVSGAYGRLASLHPAFSGLDPSENMVAACDGQLVNSLCTYEAEGGGSLRGRCLTDSDQLVCAFTGHVPDVVTTADQGSDGKAGFVYLVLADGRDAFLVGQPLRLVRAANSYVEYVSSIRDDDTQVTECSAVQNQVSCSDRLTRLSCADASELASELSDACRGFDNAASSCQSGVLSREFLSPTSIGLEYQGTLFKTNEGRLSKSDTSTSTYRLTRSSGQAFDLADHQTKANDRVEFRIAKPAVENTDCASKDSSALISSIFEAVVVAGSSGHLEISTSNSSDLELLNSWLDCGMELELSLLQIMPSDTVFVVQEFESSASQDITKIHDRIAIETSSGAGDRVQITGLVNLTLSSEEGFSCETKSTFAACTENSDCAEGVCTLNTLQNRQGDQCAGACRDSAAVSERVCSGFRLEVVPAVMNSNPVSSCPASDRGLLVAAPEDTVFIPNRSSWFTSVPGSRALRETILTSDAYLTCATHR